MTMDLRKRPTFERFVQFAVRFRKHTRKCGKWYEKKTIAIDNKLQKVPYQNVLKIVQSLLCSPLANAPTPWFH